MSHPLAEDLEHTFERVGRLWEGLQGARLFLTGGTGFFGTWLLESLLWANVRRGLGVRVVVLTRSPAAFRGRIPRLAADDAVTLHEGDVRSFTFPAGEFTHVIHAATPSAAKPGTVPPAAMLDLIIQGTRRALDFACQAGVRRFLLTSSGAIYGPQPEGLTQLPEDYPGGPDPTDVRSSYGEGKRLAELLCALYHRDFDLQATVARGFAFVGPHLPLDVHFAIGNFIRDGLRGGPIQVNGDGTPCRSYLYAADLAAWLWTILLDGQPCRPYNVGSEEAFTIAEVAGKVAAYFGVEVRVTQRPTAGRPAQRYVPSTRRARTELGLEAWVPLEEAIARTARWCRSGK